MWGIMIVMALILGAQVHIAESSTRLGLHVTQEELNCWKQRAGIVANGSLTPNCSNADTISGFTFQNIYDSRILADANTFRNASHPGADGHWEGYTGAGCIPSNPPHQQTPSASAPGNNTGLQMFKSAFVFMLTGDDSYANPVRTELLEQIAEPGTDFSNTDKWCPNNQTSTRLTPIHAFLTIPWLSRMLFAYDYLIAGGYTGFSDTEKTNIKAWLHSAAIAFDSVTLGDIQGTTMPNAYDNPPNFSCTGSCFGSDSQYAHGIYFGGPVPVEPHGNFSNRWTAAWAFGTAVGVLVNDAELVRHGRVSFELTMRFGTYSDGSHYDFVRWADCNPSCPRSGWSHGGPVLGALVTTADLLARTGDTSLYTFASPGGLRGSDGNNLGLFDVVRLWARLANRTTLYYATTESSQQIPQYLFTWDTNGSYGASHSYWDQIIALANLYYQNTEVSTSVNRTKVGGVNDCSDSHYGCFSATYVSYPDVPFMFGKMEGVVYPYIVGTQAAYWPMDQGDDLTIVTDVSPNAHHGEFCEADTCPGTPVTAPPGSETWQAGRVSGAIHLDGVNDWVEVPHHSDFDITGDITIAAWILRDSINTWDAILAKTNFSAWDYTFYLCDGGTESCVGHENQLAFWADNVGNVYSTSAITNTTDYQHVAFVRQGETYTFYINGVAAGTGTLAGQFNVGVFPLAIGRDIAHASGGNYFHGDLDEVRLYNYALNPEDILSLIEIGDRPAQVAWRCRAIDQPDAGSWNSVLNSECRVTKGGKIRVRIAMRNTLQDTPNQNYVLYCRTPYQTGDPWFPVTNDCATNDLCYTLDAVMTQHQELSSQLSEAPLLSGSTFQVGGVFIEGISPPRPAYLLEIGEYTENEHALAVAQSVSNNQTFGCCERLGSGIELDECLEAQLRVQPGKARIKP